MDIAPTGTERTEIDEGLPPEAERRLVLRLLGHWRPLCEDRVFPSIADIDPAEISDMWPNCFILDVLDDAADIRFLTIGDALATTLPQTFIGHSISGVPENSLLSVAVAHVDEMLGKGVPVSRGDEFTTAEGTRVLYRSILLPLGDDGAVINGVLGAVNCREIPKPD